ncbi:molybdate ABC transporter substrate-binding protein [Thalassospira profundimaris]|uniref:molybdate ABC transporter substrate-binding protein n=1 Tax=Thalassospira profundimaris TaxID=502049 RepID=UPI000DEDD467|nr:molybdate ABC transporter substrate-binding protein [Thalassospira profundimaris]
MFSPLPRPLLCLAAGIGLFMMPAFAQARDITVFAAASLTDAMGDVAKAYEQQNPDDNVRLSFASSSTLARQIAAGGPAEIFVSANEKWMDWLSEQDLLEAGTRRDLLGNSLVLIAPKDSKLSNITLDTKSDLTRLIGKDDRIAMGDPDHVPAGIYGKQALGKLGMWEKTESRLARADNVRAALALVEHGESPLGIVYGTDAAISKGVKIIATFPANSHPAITYPVAVMKDMKNPASTRLLDFLKSPDARAIFGQYGFTLPQ